VWLLAVVGIQTGLAWVSLILGRGGGSWAVAVGGYWNLLGSSLVLQGRDRGPRGGSRKRPGGKKEWDVERPSERVKCDESRRIQSVLVGMRWVTQIVVYKVRQSGSVRMGQEDG
jgi:hypothetical protein